MMLCVFTLLPDDVFANSKSHPVPALLLTPQNKIIILIKDGVHYCTAVVGVHLSIWNKNYLCSVESRPQLLATSINYSIIPGTAYYDRYTTVRYSIYMDFRRPRMNAERSESGMTLDVLACMGVGGQVNRCVVSRIVASHHPTFFSSRISRQHQCV